jgi:hypothetical protein
MAPHLGRADTLALLSLAITVGYGIACWIWPFRACRKCRGSGRFHTPRRLRRAGLGRGIRQCRRCDATGLRLRAGRRVHAAIRRLRTDIRP